jgi:PAS domain S-box-containing protein
LPLHDQEGKVIGMIGTYDDITESKQAEAKHTRLVTAIEQSAEGVVITDAGGNIEYVNPAFTRITGYSREEALGQNPRILKSGKQDLAFYQQLWATILKGDIWHGEVTNRRKDGSFYIEEMGIAPVRSTRGEVTHYIATKKDVTERKSMEAQLRQAAKMEAIGRLAGGVAHDFNNLLTIISGYGQLLQERLSPQDLGHVEEILKASDRAAALTRQLLAFSRRQILAPQVLDLNSVVADLEKMLRRLIGEDIDLTTLQQSGLGRVKADPGQIEQVIINLAVNARDAMPQGGKLTIETANVDLDETYALTHTGVTPGPHVMLAVADTGIGMDAEILGHIFEPFFTTKERGKGTGLGLATLYGIVKQSAGSVWVYSEPGQGTTFKIFLPRVEESGPEARPAMAPSELAKGSETVLVVEDEEGVRSLVCQTLTSHGYKVLEAAGAAQALTIAEQHTEPIHLLLTDVVMPQTGGRELAKRLSTLLHPETKVLYMSGYTDDAIVRHGVLEADTFFLQKPFGPSTLLRKVREVLDVKPGGQR